MADARASRALLLSLSAVGGGACGQLELPEPPDMSALVEAYRTPTGDITARNAALVGFDITRAARDAESQSYLEIASEVVEELEDLGGGSPTAADAAGEDQQPSLLGNRIDIAAIAHLEHVCPGWEQETENPDATTSGMARIIATLDDRGLIPTVWGTFERCRIVRGGERSEIDGPFRIHFGDGQARVSLQALSAAGYLAEVDADVLSIDTDGNEAEFTSTVHFKVFLNGEVHFLVSLADGTTLIVVLARDDLDPKNRDAVIQASILGRNSAYDCSLDLMEGSGACSDRNDPTSVIDWQ